MREKLGQLLDWLVRVTSFGRPRGYRITRLVMYDELARFGRTIAPDRTHKTLSISHSEELCHVLGLGNTIITAANYPEANILALPFGDAEFDYVVSDQVFEHIEGDPFRAMDETLRVVKPGGYIVHTTCFINTIHGSPDDFWRFTPAALRLMVDGKAEVAASAGWGNPFAWLFILLGLRMTAVPSMRQHPLHWAATFNHPKWPIVTWIVAKRVPDQPAGRNSP